MSTMTKPHAALLATLLLAAVAVVTAGYTTVELPQVEREAVESAVKQYRSYMSKYPECPGSIEFYCNQNSWNCRGYGPMELAQSAEFTRTAQGK